MPEILATRNADTLHTGQFHGAKHYHNRYTQAVINN